MIILNSLVGNFFLFDSVFVTNFVPNPQDKINLQEMQDKFNFMKKYTEAEGEDIPNATEALAKGVLGNAGLVKPDITTLKAQLDIEKGTTDIPKTASQAPVTANGSVETGKIEEETHGEITPFLISIHNIVLW